MQNSIETIKPNGIHFNFDNGLGLSIIWGGGSYTKNFDLFTSEIKNQFLKSETVEIYPLGAWPDDLKKLIFDLLEKDDWPIGYVDVGMLISVLFAIKSYKLAK